MQVDIRPEVNILGVLRHLNYKPWFAIAEFVDNSLGSFLAWDSLDPGRPKVLSVDIKLDIAGSGRLTIRDNAMGIRGGDFPRAFRAADVPPDRTGLSEFGMGMKSAASWFAGTWSVTTSAVGEPMVRRVEFDLEQITDQQTHSLSVTEQVADRAEHFTVIDLQDLHHKPQSATVAKIKNHLSSIYRSFIRSKTLSLTFNGYELSYNEVPVLSAPRSGDANAHEFLWSKPIEFSLPSGKSVKGFAALREKGSTANAGLALFRRERLILGSHDDTYRPVELFGRSNSYTYQRLFGELSLDGFGVSHTKDGFQWADEEEVFLLHLEKALREGELNLLNQAESYRAKTAGNIESALIEAISTTAQAIETSLPGVIDEGLTSPEDDSPIPDVVAGGEDDHYERTARFNADGKNWLVNVRATLDASEIDWLSVGSTTSGTDDDGRPCSLVSVSVAFGHPFSRKYLGANNENSELLVALAASVGLSLALGKLSGAKSYAILQRLNEITRKSFLQV